MITTKILMKTMMNIPIPKSERLEGNMIIFLTILQMIIIPIMLRLQMMQWWETAMLWTKCTESLKRGSGRVSLYSCLKFSCLLQTLCKRRFSIIMIFFQNLLVATNKVLDIEQLSIISPVSSQEPAFIDFIKIALHNSVTHFVHLDIFKFSVIEFQLFSSFVFLM